MGRLDSKVALITGIGGGMGRAAALRFAAGGARVVGCDLYSEGADETTALVRAAGGEIRSFAPVQLSEAQDAARWVDAAAEVCGGIDILYNASSTRFGSIDELSIEDWDFVIDNELNLAFYATRAVRPHSKKHGGGMVLDIGSIAGTRGVEFMPQNAQRTAKADAIDLAQHRGRRGRSARHPRGVRQLRFSRSRRPPSGWSKTGRSPSGATSPVSRSAASASRRTSSTRRSSWPRMRPHG